MPIIIITFAVKNLKWLVPWNSSSTYIVKHDYIVQQISRCHDSNIPVLIPTRLMISLEANTTVKESMAIPQFLSFLEDPPITKSFTAVYVLAGRLIYFLLDALTLLSMLSCNPLWRLHDISTCMNSSTLMDEVEMVHSDFLLLVLV